MRGCGVTRQTTLSATAPPSRSVFLYAQRTTRHYCCTTIRKEGQRCMYSSGIWCMSTAEFQLILTEQSMAEFCRKLNETYLRTLGLPIGHWSCVHH